MGKGNGKPPEKGVPRPAHEHDDDPQVDDGGQTLSDHDQVFSDSDQTLSDRDQRASDDDQAASDRGPEDLAGSVSRARTRAIRAGTTRERLAAGHQRADTALARDRAAQRRDELAAQRDRDADVADHLARELDGTDALVDGHARAKGLRALLAKTRERAARDRGRAAKDRARTARDRELGARDREESRQDHDYLTAVTASMGEGLITVDQSGRVLHMNATAEEWLGWTFEELLGQDLHELTHYRRPDGSPYPAEECPLMVGRQGRIPVRVDEDVFYRRDGSPLPVSYRSVPFALTDGATGAVILFEDLSERKRSEWAVRASEAQLKAIVENTTAAIYVKRKDDYRYLLGNPEFENIHGLEPGAAAGMRDEDLASPSTVETIRETDRRVIAEGTEVALEEELLVAGEPRTYLTLKFPLPDQSGKPYAVCCISTDITERKRREAELHDRLEWEERIRRAVNEEHLLVYAQPIVDLRTGAVVQEELLVRMRGSEDPDEVVAPRDFLPQAEHFGLVGHIDRYMVNRGIALAAQGRSVEINLSGRSIGDRALTRQIERELQRTGADPSRIIFEITETSAVEDIEAAGEFSMRIARMGCKCALDDFGTGFGSLTYQRNLVVQYLKIDISFVLGMSASRADQRVVKSIVRLARDYGQQTVAEGVEDEQTLELLRDFGVDYAQGYHVGRPQPLGMA